MNELKPRAAEQATCSAKSELSEIDVMRALVICAKPYVQDKFVNCKTCPYWVRECDKEFIPDVIALIREKDALLEQWDADFKTYEAMLMSKDAEIERLNKLLDDGYWDFAYDIIADAITEFAERLKASLNDVARWQMHGVEGEYFIIGKSLIDRIAKEMKGEGDE